MAGVEAAGAPLLRPGLPPQPRPAPAAPGPQARQRPLCQEPGRRQHLP